jgi:hypothetical protein
MQTEYARQQQFITFGMLLLLLGPLTLVAAGMIAGVVGRRPRRMLVAAGIGVLALAVAGALWQRYYELAKELWAEGSAAYHSLLTAQASGHNPDYWALAQDCWPPLWRWWQWSLATAPFAALNLLNSRVR